MDRIYQDGEVTLRLGGLDKPDGIRVHLEHRSGAALIVPSSVPEGGDTLRLVGFDGTRYALKIADPEVVITASGASALLGGQLERRIPRAPDPIAGDRGVRVTGDESTMPISVDD